MSPKNLCFDSAAGSLRAGSISMTLKPFADGASDWRLVRHDEHETVWDSSLGRWTLQTASSGSDLKLRLLGDLKQLCPGLTFGLKAADPVELTHALGLGPRMGRCLPVVFPCPEERQWNSSILTMLTRNSDHLMISVPLRNPAWTEFRGIAKGNGLNDFELNFRIADDTSAAADSGWIEFSLDGDPFQRMTGWTDRNVTVEKDFSKGWIAGWNSWDYYRWTITEEEVLRNARFIAADPVLSKYVKRIIVDDGWQYCYGEWDANPLFPHGMKYLADELKKLGFEPGLWIAPTIIEPHCRIAQLNKDWLAMSEGGQPCLGYSCMERHGFLLDPTVPEVREFLRNLFDRYAAMGYSYFKLDFMGSTLEARKFHDPSVPRTEIPRMIVQAAYEGAKDRAQILGCNYFYCGGNEFVDSVRIGGDIHARWENIMANAVAVASMFHTNGRLWINDPDFSLARGPETSCDPDLDRLQCITVYIRPESPYLEGMDDFKLATMSRQEGEVLLSLVVISGGIINFSDNMPRLNESGLNLLRRAVAAEHGSSGLPLDLFESVHAGTWLQRMPDGSSRVLLINWSDAPVRKEFDLKAHGIAAGSGRNFWNDRPVDVQNGRICAELPAHSCLLTVLD